jgi:hypothetical protein
MSLDWRFQVTACAAAPALSPACAAEQLAAHLAAQEPAPAVLHTLLREGLSAYHCPPPLRPALKDARAVALALVALSPSACACLISAFRAFGPSARALWEAIRPYVAGDPLAALALTVARPDLYAFAAGAHQLLVARGAPRSWLAAAIKPPWRVAIGSPFHADVLAAATAAEIPFVPVAKNPTIALFGDVGVRCLEKDSVLLVLLLFFGFRDYAAAIPPSAPAQLLAAHSAPWLTPSASPSSSTTTSTRT